VQTDSPRRLLAGFLVLLGGLIQWAGCGAGIFNPAFLNTVAGGQFPVTPGPGADFVMVRALNETGQNVEFIVTIERDELVLDEEGNFQVDDQGNFVTRTARETVRLQTGLAGNASELGVLFPCDVSPVTLVGLGEELLPSDAAVFVDGDGPGGAPGFGVTAANLNPLSLDAENFSCGDTITFRAFQSIGVPGGIALQSFLLPGESQPSIFTGPNTFVNYQTFLESQVREDDP